MPIGIFLVLGLVVLLIVVVVAICVWGTYGNLTLSFPPRPTETAGTADADTSLLQTKLEAVPLVEPLDALKSLNWSTYFSKLKATDGRDATAINAVAGATKTDETFQSGKLSPERRLEIEKWLEAWQIRIDATDDSRTLEAITTNAWWKLKQMILGHGHETLEQNMAQFGGLLKDADCTNALELKIDAFCGEQMEQKEIDQKQHNESLIRFLSSFQDMLPTLMPHAPVDWIAEQIVHLEKQMRTSQGLLEQVTWLDYFIEQWKSYLPHSIAASKQHCIPKKLIHWAVETTARSYQDTLQKLRAPTMQEVETMVRFARF